ncbi:NAC domain-containing protein 82-like isoform X2 [Gastrolobium bilobum]|uniref:NAC domain-containing protein 82-like isoform X2 n=1 Tax=Gastrolobium bilobum TaxID=150636 RepID=UPI002AAF4ED1|nr:NAC domain-containing protein 82-like isoform X2 [Gastrolobium bilobum]
MAQINFIPGFRFHPTDVELVMYFLKRKILGKKFPVDVIAELDIYKYAPWDLPDKSLLRNGDLEWYFFCPRGRKYSTGGRMNRATEDGYWKTTGKDRSIEHENQVVAMIKTLVFHRGRPPKGDRTDWVMHEFRLEDKDLTDKGIPQQDSYVICKVFQKEGPGPRNGAQYGKPFNEEDWDKEEISVSVPAMSAQVPIQPSTSHISVEKHMHSSTTGCIGLTSVSSPSGLSSYLTHPSAPSNQVDDDILRMLDYFKEDDYTLPVNENNGIEANNAEAAPYLDQSGFFDDLGDLDCLLGCDEEGGFFCGQKDECPTNEDDLGPFDPPNFLELTDLVAPLLWKTQQNGSRSQDKKA